MITPPITKGDDLVLKVTVLENGAAKDMSAAAIAATAEMAGITFAPTSTDMSAAAAGDITVTWNDPGFSPGHLNIQVRATIGAVDQTVFRDTIQVLQGWL